MKHYIITGTSRGLGKALAEIILEKKDSTVLGIARSPSFIEDQHYQHISFDLSEVRSLSTVCDTWFSKIDSSTEITLINNAGMLGAVQYLGSADPEDIIRIHHLNTITPFILTNAFLKAYSGRVAKSTIVNISSGAGSRAMDGWSSYCASKAAINMLSEVTALEAEKKGSHIRVYAIAPGVVDTEMQQEIRASHSDNFSSLERFKDLKKEGKLWSPKQSAEKILHLLEHQDQYTGVMQDVRNL